MQIIPIPIGKDQFSLFVILEADNMARILRCDPAEITLDKLGEPWSHLRLKDVVLMYATVEELETVREMFESGKGGEALQMLARGFKYKPESDDHDGPYERVK